MSNRANRGEEINPSLPGPSTLLDENRGSDPLPSPLDDEAAATAAAEALVLLASPR